MAALVGKSAAVIAKAGPGLGLVVTPQTCLPGGQHDRRHSEIVSRHVGLREPGDGRYYWSQKEAEPGTGRAEMAVGKSLLQALAWGVERPNSEAFQRISLKRPHDAASKLWGNRGWGRVQHALAQEGTASMQFIDEVGLVVAP